MTSHRLQWEQLTPHVRAEVETLLGGARVVSARSGAGGYSPSFASRCDLDPWTCAHLGDLVALESGWRAAVRGDALVHLDVRSDNVLLTSTGAVFVDWPHACSGALGLDLLVMLPSVALEGGGEPEDGPWPDGRPVPLEPSAIDAIVAGLAGYFVHQSGMPDSPGLPTVRAFQRAQAGVALRWIRSRVGESEPQ